VDDRYRHVVCVDQTQEMHPAKLCRKRKKTCNFSRDLRMDRRIRIPLIKRCVIYKAAHLPAKNATNAGIGILSNWESG